MMDKAVCASIKEHGADYNAWEFCASFDVMANTLIIFLLVWFISKGSAKTASVRDTKRMIVHSIDPKERYTESSQLNAPLSPLSAQSSCSDDERDDGDDEIFLRSEQILKNEIPRATYAERRRFLIAKKGNVSQAATSLRQYIDWLSIHEAHENQLNLDSERAVTDDADLVDWNISCAIAIRACNEECSEKLPRVIRTYQDVSGSYICDRHGHRIFHIIPAQMDERLVKTSTYALATSIYINRILDRQSLMKITVCMDARAGKGWRNIHAARLIPFMKQTTQMLLSLFPQRLNKCLVYPVPSAFMFIWRIMQQCMERETSEKIILCRGVNKIESPAPIEQMCGSLTVEVATLLEQARVSAFRA